MKNASSLKPNNKIDSPKTPGGISKSLLTPCRRVGLSRNWRKSGPIPFISPLAGSPEVKLDKQDQVLAKKSTRKRKERCDEDESKVESPITLVSIEISPDVEEGQANSVIASKSDHLETTPLRHVSNPRRKKSKTLLSSQVVSKNNIDIETPKSTSVTENIETFSEVSNIKPSCDNIALVDTPIRTKSKSKVTSILDETCDDVEIKENVIRNLNVPLKVEQTPDNEAVTNPKQKSPDNLTKECIVVIQKNIYKKDLEKLKQKAKQEKVSKESASQALFDSDSDDVPLSTLNYKELKTQPKQVILDDDDDFEDNTKIKIKKLEDKTTSMGGMKADNKKKNKSKKDLSTKNKPKKSEVTVLDSNPVSQSSIDDDEDFVMDNKRTILIKKCYDKVTKPLKAKSTGSITQKDIDDLKAKIEVKKKLLLAKAVTKDTEELRDLIKKWQRGCQDALMELMELMRNKFPDKQNMDYSEILQSLKIPASLVGYDEDNDCFGTPTDESIILSKFNDA